MEKYCPKCGKVYKGKNSDANVCMYCAIPLKEREGRIPLSNELRERVRKRDGYRCVRCGASINEKRLEVDHIIPVSKGGTNDIDNLQTLCWECNLDKGPHIPESGLKYDIKDKENELATLENVVKEHKNKLKSVTDENEKYKLLAHIKKLEEEIPNVKEELSKLLLEFNEEQEEIKLQQEEKERKENLFNRLYVTLNDNDVDFLVSYFSLTRKPLDKLIKQIIEEYSDNEIAEALLKKERYDNLVLDYSQEKMFIKYFSLYNYSTDDLKLYLVKNGYSQEDIDKLTKKAKNKIFNDLNANLNKNQHFLMCYKFNNSKNETLNFFIYHDFSIDKFKQELTLTKNKLYNKISNLLRYNNSKILKRHFSLDNSSDEELIEYLIVNEYITKKDINDLIDLEKDTIFNQFYGKLDDKQLFYARIKFKNFKEDFINYLIDNDYSYEKLISDLNLTERRIFDALSNSLTLKEKSLLKHYLKLDSWKNGKLIKFLMDHKYSSEQIQKMIKASKKYFTEELNKTLNPASTELLIEKYGLNNKSNKNDLINFLLTNEIIVPQILDDIDFVKKDMLKSFDEKLDYKQISYMRYKALKYGYNNLYMYLQSNDNIMRIIDTGKEEFMFELSQKIDYPQVYTISRKLNVPSSKKGLPKYLVEHYSVEEINEMLK